MYSNHRFLIVAAAVLLAACGSEKSESSPDLAIESFACEPRVDPLGASCSWQVEASSRPVPCSLSAEGADTVNIADCSVTKTALLPIDREGDVVVDLEARAGTAERKASTTVKVPLPKREPPSIQTFVAEPTEGRAPLDVAFHWEIGGRGLRCELDFDGDATTDQTIDSCTSASVATHRYTETGSHNARLVVKDSRGYAAERNVTINVSAPSAPVIASFDVAPASGTAPLDAAFTWAISNPDGGALTCRLDFDGDGTADETIADCTSASAASHVYAAGRYAPALEVENEAGLTARASRSVDVQEVIEENDPPAISSLTASPSSGTAPLAVTFGWAISDPDGDALRCTLDFDSDGQVDETIDPCTSSSAAGHDFSATSTTTLAVTDAAGNRATKTAQITVSTAPKPTVGDLSISHTEWGQSVIKQQLVLVGGKEVLLRVHALGSTSGIAGTRARARIFSGSNLLGTLQLAGPDAPPTSVDASTLSKQYTATVPASYVVPGMSVVVELDPDNLLAETNESNNTVTLTPVVRSANPLPITAVPVRWNGLTGTVVDVREKVTQLWPVHALDVKTHAAFTYTPDASFSWSELLSDIGALRRADGSSRYYVGFVPGTPSSGTVGIGYVGSPACAVKDDSRGTPDIVAHELGHNFGLRHAPCGTSGDADYPYENARLGTQGWDYVNKAIVPPNSAYDLMSYCSPEWVSDYNYEKVQAWLQSRPLPAPTAQDQAYEPGTPATFERAEAFLVSGVMTEGGIVLRPVQRMVVSEEQPEFGAYTLRAWTESGELTVPVSFEVVDHADAPERHFTAVIPTAGEVLLGLEILKDGEPIFEEIADVKVAGAPTIEDEGTVLKLSWDASTHPWAAVAFIDAEGERNTLALTLRNGHATVPLHGLAAEGTFEVSLSSGVDAQRFTFER